MRVFSEGPSFVVLRSSTILAPLPVSSRVSDLSTVLLGRTCCRLLGAKRVVIRNVPMLDPAYLVPFGTGT